MDTSSRLDVLAGTELVRPRESALGQEAPKKALNRKRARTRRLIWGGLGVALVAGLSSST